MTPKEKAKELIAKFMEFTPAEELFELPYAMRCASICVDEIFQTLGIAAACVLTGYGASQYLRGYWGRRGRPGILSRAVQRAGIKRFRGYYTRHPEKIAGKDAVKIYDEHLVQNPEKLEELARKAGLK